MARKNVNAKFTPEYRDLKKDIEKRYMLLGLGIAATFFIMIINLYALQFNQHEYYAQKLAQMNRTIITGSTAPRGRIYDRNYNLLVDNEPVKTITYRKQRGVNQSQELAMAGFLAKNLTIDHQKLTQTQLKEYFIIQYPKKANAKITASERQKLQERRLTRQEINNLKRQRITPEDLSVFNQQDQKKAYLYFLMNQGFWFSEKTIKKNVDETEYALISENLDQLPGFSTNLDWQRSYPYGDTFKTLLGTVSEGIPRELKKEYLNKGYRLNDRVGATNIERQFDNYLRGTPNQYQLIDNRLKLIQEGQRGYDIVLTIDIELQLAIEEIVHQELINAKNERNTEHLEHSFVVIQHPQTGEILALVARKLYATEDGYDTYDYSPAIITDAVVAGSAIKGASQHVAYMQDALEIGERRNDFCIKIAATPRKCSWTYLGVLNDINALRSSSNSYQYQSAIKVGNGEYRYNQPLPLDPKAFQIYRDGFAEFGLGIKTGIDLPNETRGYQGRSLQSGHLLDFVIGQYDTYTPIQLSQYISTIANNGKRLKPQLLKSVYQPTNFQHLVKSQSKEVLSYLNTEDEYLERIQAGFRAVMLPRGTGRFHAPANLNVAGKTGTSESFVDSNQDGTVDTLTLSNTFVAYAPYDNPIVSFTITTPNIYHFDGPTRHRTQVNRRISNQVIEKFFAMY